MKRSPGGANTRPAGALSRPGSGPSSIPEWPGKPTTVLTACEATTILLTVDESATNRLPAPSLAIAAGASKRASVPVPSTWPDFPGEPARIVAVPVAMTILRIVYPDVSVTKRFPCPSTAAPRGQQERLIEEMSSLPQRSAGPTTVVTSAVAITTLRMA